jgi:transcriptional regulator with XRE-family HTH domain
MATALGAKLKGLCKAKGLSSSDLGRLAGIEKSTLSGYENGGDPPFSKLKALAAALEVRAGYFFEEIPELNGISFEQVAAYESLRSFLVKLGTAEPGKHPYTKILTKPAIAPKTVLDWDLFHQRESLLHQTNEGTVRVSVHGERPDRSNVNN